MQTTYEPVIARSRTGLTDYKLCLFPPRSVTDKLQNVLTSFQEKPFDPTFEIVLAKFSVDDRVEKTMLRFFENMIRTHCKFDLTLNNFGGDPHGSIFLRLMDPYKLQCFFHSFLTLEEFLRNNNCKSIRYFGRHPVFIWKNLGEDIFLERMLTLSKVSFCEVFRVNALHLFKKDNLNKTDKLLQIFQLR